MRKKDIDRQLEQLKAQRELLKDAEAQFVERQKQIEEEKRKEEEANRKPYKVFGRDFSVIEPSVVQYYKNRMKMLVVQYKLVGGFNDEGVYIIPKEIKYDLIAMNKAIEDMGDDYYKVTALYMTKHFNFTIKLTMLDDGRARASLYIAEYVGSYAENETMYTFVADFVDVYDADYRVKLRKVFNLYDVEVKNDDLVIPNIAVLLQDLYDIDKYVGGLYDMSAQIYVLRMLKLLESGGEFEEGIIEEYKKLLLDLDEEKFGAKDDPTKRSKNEILKECLDKAIDDKGGLEKLTVDKKKLDDVLADVNKMDTEIGDLKVGGLMEIDLPDKKEEKKPSAAAVPAKKKPAKKPAKKEEKKQEKKKEKNKEEAKKGGEGVTLSPSASAGGILEAIEGIREGINEWIEDILKPEPEKEAKPLPEERPQRPNPENEYKKPEGKPENEKPEIIYVEKSPKRNSNDVYSCFDEKEEVIYTEDKKGYINAVSYSDNPTELKINPELDAERESD